MLKQARKIRADLPGALQDLRRIAGQQFRHQQGQDLPAHPPPEGARAAPGREKRLLATPGGTEQLEMHRGRIQGLVRLVGLSRPAPSYFLPEDPLRTKVQSFDLLSKEEQIEWIVEVKSGLLLGKLEELEEYGRSLGRRALQGAGCTTMR